MRALQNEKYIGIQRFSDIVIEDACPALVDRETFDKVQERIKQNRREGGKNRTISAIRQYPIQCSGFCLQCAALKGQFLNRFSAWWQFRFSAQYPPMRI